MINEMIFILKSAIITIALPLLREVIIVLHLTRPFSCFIGFAHSRLVFFVCRFDVLSFDALSVSCSEVSYEVM